MRLTTTVAGAGVFCLVMVFVLTVTTAEAFQDETQRAGDKQIRTQASTRGLTLAEALSLTLQHSPSLAAFSEEIRSRDAAALQAGLLPNPTLAVDVENFAGEDELQGFDSAETTIALSQLIELGGKRGKRRQVATLDKELAGWDYQSKKLDVLTATTKAFILVLTLQKQVTQDEELADLAEQTLSAVTARVDAGKVPPLDETRARIELATANSLAARASRELEAARRRLVTFWGADRADFAQVIGDLTSLSPLPAEESLQHLLDNNPDVARWEMELEQREVSLALARIQAFPDVNFSIGVRNLRDSDSNALVAGIELPLPLFDRNQGGAGEARANLERARRERQAAETETRTRIVEAWQDLAAAHGEATTLKDEILPWAESVFEAADFGYRQGKFDFLQMIDAQRTLFEVKGQYLLSLATYHRLRTDLQRLIGAPLHELSAI
ncbi:MAG: TolC family protein [Desulfuromonadales bacterium]|nr:TolC family protein [Desulfuromonadales bacterium]